MRQTVNKVEILKWKDKTWLEIPNQDKPIEGEECIIIAKRICSPPPKENTDTWEVLRWRQDVLNDMNWDLEYSGLFWEFEDAELFAEALVKNIT